LRSPCWSSRSTHPRSTRARPWPTPSGAQWPSYLAYMVSFLTIGVVWLNHHRIFTQVHRVDGPLLVLNLNLLLWTALIPFPTAVVAEYLQGAASWPRPRSPSTGRCSSWSGCHSGACSPGSPATTGSSASSCHERSSAPPAYASWSGGRLHRRSGPGLRVATARPGSARGHSPLLHLRPGDGADGNGVKRPGTRWGLAGPD
jgi:Endosomal/lysosomal potassium channel TMEM175